MISVKATVTGEPDLPPFTRTFDYSAVDEEVFLSLAAMIEAKLQCRMKINTNETLLLYCSFVVKAIRSGYKDSMIQELASKLLAPDNVMIGVPETLRKITFEARIDTKPAKKIDLAEPISVRPYTLA